MPRDLTPGDYDAPVFSLGGDIKVNQGALTLAVNKPAAVDDGLLSTYQQSIGIAKEVVLKDALPVTVTGKLMRRDLKPMAAALVGDR